MPTPDTIYSVHPDVVTQAIKLLCSLVALLGGGFITTLLYIWHKMTGKIDSIGAEMGKISKSIENMDKTTSMEIAGIKIRCSMIHPDNPHAHIRATDLLNISTGQ